jgi:hypothetical protein
MNDDLHKTFEPEPVPDETPIDPAPSGGGWKMPVPVFRRSTGRSAKSSNAPTTIVPARQKKTEAAAPQRDKPTEPTPAPEQPPTPALSVEPQPFVPDAYEPVDLDFSDLREPEQPRSKLHFGIAAVVLLALIGIVSAVLIAVYLGYIVWHE